MKDPKDEGTTDWVDEPKADALKDENGNLQLPLSPQNLLKSVALHCIAEGRDPVDLIQDIHDATCFWLHDHDMRQQFQQPRDYTRGLDS